MIGGCASTLRPAELDRAAAGATATLRAMIAAPGDPLAAVNRRPCGAWCQASRASAASSIRPVRGKSYSSVR